MHQRRWMIVGAALFAAIGCNEATSCPPDYPIERDGFCYRDGDGGEDRMDAGATEGDAGDPSACSGEHPLMDGDRRYCEPGACFCADPDACFPSASAASCCTVDVVCGDDAGATDAGPGGADAGPGLVDAGPGPSDAGACMGTHPLVEGARRYCDPGACFCADPDACFAAGVAAGCCSVGVVCE